MNDPPAAVAEAEQEGEAMAAPRVLGRLKEFDPKVENISTYLERVELYFDANAVNQDRQAAVMLIVIGSQTYDILRSLLAPTLPKDKTFEELKEGLPKHFNPKQLVIGERFYFYKRTQKPNELTCCTTSTKHPLRIWNFSRTGTPRSFCLWSEKRSSSKEAASKRWPNSC